MAKIDFYVTRYATGRGSGAATLPSSRYRISGQDTITTVENLEDGSGDITVAAGDVLCVHTDTAIRLAFGGTAATGTTGFFVAANLTREIEIHARDAGAVSVIEAS